MTAIERKIRTDRRWDEDDELAEPAARPLSRDEADALRAKDPPLSPWRVVAVQAAVGLAVAVLSGLVTGRGEVAWSALYGAAAVVLPGALMARGMTSAVGRVSPGLGAVSFMLWEFVKIAVAIAMLMLAPRVVQDLSWPALLFGLVVCMKVYWFALLWRGRRIETSNGPR
jgi:ATP synthase protein I